MMIFGVAEVPPFEAYAMLRSNANATVSSPGNRMGDLDYKDWKGCR
jgi:hypothetical protein